LAQTVPSSLFVASLKTILRQHPAWLPRAAYVATVLIFFWFVAAFYVPGKGFTAMIMFGDRGEWQYLPDLKAMEVYVETDSYGYDAQYYAQIAMRPEVRDPQLALAVDNISYRARRILFSWTAWLLAAGEPQRAVHVFAVQNILCWLVLAALLLRWFPATNWENYLRWTAVLFSYGVWFSVRGALVDGPSLLLIAAGVALAESGRSWWSAIVFGVSGLAKETNILAGGVLIDFRERTLSGWLKMGARGALLILPLALWAGVLWNWFGQSGGTGERNFSLPLAGYFEKWKTTLAQWNGEPRHPLAYTSMLWMIAVSVQFLFIVLRPRWNELWWRVGAAFAVLMVFLGGAVWEGLPGAAGRVLLPMALAFNVLIPRGRIWMVLLILGNLTIFGISPHLKLPPYQSVEIRGTHALMVHEPSGKRLEVSFPTGWHLPERSRGEYWRWSSGPADVRIMNPHPRTVIADVSFGLRSKNSRMVRVKDGDQLLWSGQVGDSQSEITLRGVRFAPGETVWRFETDQESLGPDPHDSRLVAFSLRNLVIELLNTAE
jgi:hypothetical protein